MASGKNNHPKQNKTPENSIVKIMIMENNDDNIKKKEKKRAASPAGFEPATSGLEVQRAIHCATGTPGNLPKIKFIIANRVFTPICYS